MKQFTGEWIRVSDELPQEDGPYLVSCQIIEGDEKFTDVSVWQDGQWEITMPGNDYVRPFEIVAWSPYPEPY